MRNPRTVYNWLPFNRSGVCALCGTGSGGPLDLCPDCRADLPRLSHACLRCARPLPGASGPVCGACLRQPPPFARAHGAFVYAPPLDRLIVELKFRDQLYLTRTLGTLLAEAAASWEPASVDVLMPIPLHPARLRIRGYNQALELARPLSRRLGIALAPEHLRRTRATPAQAGLSARERRRNVRGSFQVTKPVSDLRIALIDDVLTTGATAGEAARRLRQAGAASVVVWTLARAVGPAR